MSASRFRPFCSRRFALVKRFGRRRRTKVLEERTRGPTFGMAFKSPILDRSTRFPCISVRPATHLRQPAVLQTTARGNFGGPRASGARAGEDGVIVRCAGSRIEGSVRSRASSYLGSPCGHARLHATIEWLEDAPPGLAAHLGTVERGLKALLWPTAYCSRRAEIFRKS